MLKVPPSPQYAIAAMLPLDYHGQLSPAASPPEDGSYSFFFQEATSTLPGFSRQFDIIAVTFPVAAFSLWESGLLIYTELIAAEKKKHKWVTGSVSIRGHFIHVRNPRLKYFTYWRTQHHTMVTNLMSILSLEEHASCVLATLSLGYSITLLGQLLLNSALCVRNHTSLP